MPSMLRTFRPATVLVALLAAAGLLLPTAVGAQPSNHYQVTITNLTASQPITPPVVVTHQIGVHLFVPGAEAPEPLIPLAEEGDPTELVAVLEDAAAVHEVVVGDGPLLPGESTTVEIEVRGRSVYLSAVGMLATTNDAFFGLDSYFLNRHPWSRHVLVPAYDAGSEENNELCQFIPGPPCESPESRAPDGAEGFVHVHSGILGGGDLLTEEWSWHNPVVRIDVVRLPPQRGGSPGR